MPVRAFGQFGIQIEESKKFLIKLVGTLSQFDKNTRSWISDNKCNILEVKDIENYLKKNGIEHELL